jgi:hypothetical protein
MRPAFGLVAEDDALEDVLLVGGEAGVASNLEA